MDEHHGLSSFGYEENVVAAASYFFLAPYIFLKEKSSHFARFHALQAIMGYAVLFVFWMLITFIPFLYFLKWAPGICATIFVAIMILKAYDGEEFKFPVIGNLAFGMIYESAEDLLAEAEAEAEAPEVKTQDPPPVIRRGFYKREAPPPPKSAEEIQRQRNKALKGK